MTTPKRNDNDKVTTQKPDAAQDSEQSSSRAGFFRRFAGYLLITIAPFAILWSGWNVWQDVHDSPIQIGSTALDIVILVAWTLVLVSCVVAMTKAEAKS